MFLEGLQLVFTLTNFGMMIMGLVIGLSFGAIPGLTFITGIILVLPLTFGIEPVAAISLLLGIYCGGMTGGSVASVLLGIPGTPSAAATVLDGYELNKQGQPGKALGMSLFASVFGGLFSLLVLAGVAPLIARVAVRFGPVELFALVVLGFSTICRVSEKNLVKGLIAGCIGLTLTTIGLDPIAGQPRFVFNSYELMNGIGIMPVLIGIFAIPEIINAFSSTKKEENYGERNYDPNVKMELPNWAEIKMCFPAMWKSAIIGTIIGAIPGTSGPIACFLGYDQAKRSSKHPELFGKGALEGVAAPESANNAVSGGVMIPLMTLGIPGDSASAIILGAFLIHGLTPGPLLFRENGNLVYAILISLFIINILMLIIHYFGIRLFIRLFNISKLKLSAAIMTLCVIGAFAPTLNYFDVYVMLFAGMLGFVLNKFGFPTTPLLLGTVLGGIIEENFVRSLIMSKGDYSIFVTRPISLCVFLATFLILFGNSLKKTILGRKQ